MKACRAYARALLVVLVLAAVAACSSSGAPKTANGAVYGVEVSGKFGEAPTARIAAPLSLDATATQVAIAGTGAPVQIDQLFVLQLTLFSGRTGKQVASTLDAGQVPVVAKSSDDTLFPALVEALKGKTQGSRVVVALPAAAAFGAGGVPPAGLTATDPVVVVADVLAVPPLSALPRAAGEPVQPPAGSPTVETIADDPTSVTHAASAPPTEITVIPLITGTGAPVRDRSLVTLDYLGQEWTSSTPVVDTYFKEPVVVPVGANGSVPAWDRALVGLPAGSRVLVIDPDPPVRVPGAPGQAVRGTISWVIDVLGVS